MKNKLALLLAMALLSVATARYYGDNDNDDNFVPAPDDDDDKRSIDEMEPVEQEKREAVEFFKRLFHPFSTKNEEIKRETREVYEEKCESVVPTQRFCPELKTW